MEGWTYSASLLRARKNQFIKDESFLKCAESDGRDSVLKFLKETPYGALFSNDNLENYEKIFDEYIVKLYAELSEIVPEKTVINAEKAIYDLNNMKFIFKSKFLSTKFNWSILTEFGNIKPEILYTYIEKKLYYNFPAIFSKSLYKAEMDFADTGSKQDIDFILDKAFFDYKLDIFRSKKTHSGIEPVFRMSIDMENIKNIIRAKKLGFSGEVFDKIVLSNGLIAEDILKKLYNENFSSIIEYISKSEYGEQLAGVLTQTPETFNFSLLEKSLDQITIAAVKKFVFVTEGPEVLYEYITLKKMEIKNLKILIIGKLNGIPSADIKNRLRMGVA